MKTAEEFLSHAEERLMLLKIFGYTPKEDQINDLCKIMEHFRKESMKEAWKHSYYECDAELQRGDWVVAQGSGTLEENFEEWYKENKERCEHDFTKKILYDDLIYCKKCRIVFDKVVYEEWYNNQIKEA